MGLQVKDGQGVQASRYGKKPQADVTLMSHWLCSSECKASGLGMLFGQPRAWYLGE